MVKFIKAYWKHLLVFTLAGLIGGFFTGLYLLDSYPGEIQEQIMAQGMTDVILGLVCAVQYAGYGLVLGVLGIILSKQVGLWKEKINVEKKPLGYAMLCGVIGGLLLIGLDLLWFGKYVPAIADSYLIKPSVDYILGVMILGGIVEEVMLRLFMMSLIAFVLLKIFKKAENTDKIFVLANLLSALLFAAGHLPTTAVMLGITPLILFRCFLLNGGLGLAFGWLYRKHGLHYAMIAHAGCHLVSKFIWILFL